MQGKGGLIQANVAPLYINTDSRIQGEKEWYNFWGEKEESVSFKFKNSRRMREFLKQKFNFYLKKKRDGIWQRMELVQ